MNQGTLLLLGAVAVGWWLRGRRSRPASYAPAPGWGGAPQRGSGPSAKGVMLLILAVTGLLLGVTMAGAEAGKVAPKKGSGPSLAGIFGAFSKGLPKIVAPKAVGKGNVCPVNGRVRFSDTWGAPRSGGRRHKGVDIFARHGTPLVAVTNARVVRAGSSTLGGLGVTIRDSRGTSYYYAHNSRNLVRTGQRVRKGQRVALLGKTGNARDTAPHVHFEVRPHGQAVNPTSYVRRWC